MLKGNTMTKDEALRRAAETRAELEAVAQRIPPGRMEEPNAVGDWSPRDVLGHVATWDLQDTLIIIRLQNGGSLPTYPSDFNEREVEQQRKLTMDEVWELFARNHRGAMEFLRDLPESALQHPDVLRMVTEHVDHYRQHADDLRRWLSRP